MGSEQKKRKRHWQQYLAVAVFMLIGAVCGILMVEYIDAMFEAEKSAGEIALSTALLFIGMYAAIYLQIIFHEAGHLLFGRMTGYRFSSFRIGSLMWIKEDGRLCFRRLSVAAAAPNFWRVQQSVCMGTANRTGAPGARQRCIAGDP